MTGRHMEFPRRRKGAEAAGGQRMPSDVSPWARQCSAGSAYLPLEPIQYPVVLAWRRHGNSVLGLAPAGPVQASDSWWATIQSPTMCRFAARMLALAALRHARTYVGGGVLFGESRSVVGSRMWCRESRCTGDSAASGSSGAVATSARVPYM